MNRVLSALFSFMLLVKLGVARNQPPAILESDSTIQWLEDHLYQDSIRYTLRTTALELAATLQSAQQKDRLAKVHQLLADWHDYYNEFSRDSALYYQQKALDFYHSSGDQKMLAEAHISLSNIYINDAEFKLAEEQIFKALAIFESFGDKNGQGVAYRRIAQIYMVTEAPERALEYDLQALELLEAAEDHYNTCLSLMNMTNSLKYAFPDKRPGLIHIQLDRDQDNFVLEVSDNGPGPLQATDSDGFGSELVEMLTQQLRGTMEQDHSSGFCTRVIFPYAKMAS